MSEIIEPGGVCFQQSPCGVLIADDQGTILQINPALEAMLGVPAEHFIGTTRETLEPAAYRCLFDGAGTILVAGPDVNQQRWLSCTESEGSAYSVKFYLDVTEQVLMQQQISALQEQVNDLTITDALTGLANPRALSRALNSQVTRSRRYNNPLCLAVVALVDHASPGTKLSDEAVLAASRYLRERLRWVDTIARWDHDHFIIILPETVADDANDLISQISVGFLEDEEASRPQGHHLELRFGLAQWNKGNDSQMLMDRAAQALSSTREMLVAVSNT